MSSSTSSAFVSATRPWRTSSRSRICVCSSVCGIQPSFAATTSTATSTAPTPASMFFTKRTWPGTSTKPTTWPDGERAEREPEIDREPAFLLLGEAVGIGAGERPHERRLAVIDVARGRDALSWRTRARRASRASSTGSTVRRSHTTRSSSTRATMRARPQPRRELVDRRRLDRDPARRDREPRQRPAAGGRFGVDDLHARHCAPRSLPRAPAARRRACTPCARTGSTSRRRRGTRARPPASPASVSLSARSARASGCAFRRSTSARRPTMIPACGPPSSLSPEKVTSAAPASMHWRTPGSSRSHDGRARQPRRRLVEQAGARVDDDRRAEPGELGDRRRRDEADHAVVRRVHLQHERDVVGDARARSRSAACGSSCRPRRGARRSPRGSPGIRKPPPISTSSPRDTSTERPRAKCREHEHHRGRVVVHDDARLRAARGRERRARVLVPRAAHTLREPVLDVRVAARTRHRVERGRAERCAAEVGVQQHAGRVHDRSEQRQRAPARARSSRVAQHVVGRDRAPARRVDRVPRELGAHGVGQRRIELGEHPLDARQPAPRVRTSVGRPHRAGYGAT